MAQNSFLHQPVGGKNLHKNLSGVIPVLPHSEISVQWGRLEQEISSHTQFAEIIHTFK